MKVECTVDEVAPLRVPKVFRVKSTCGNINLEVELHEEVVTMPKVGDKLLIAMLQSKEECLDYYFCAHGYVVSNTKIDDTYRVVISLHGLLVVLKSKEQLPYKTMDHIYIGLNFVQS